MSAAAEPGRLDSPRAALLGSPWRLACERAQESSLPDGQVAVSCSAEVGRGGLGRHLEELLEALHRGGRPAVRVLRCGPTLSSADTRRARAIEIALGPSARLSPAWRALRSNLLYDRQAASRLPACEHLLAFSGQALDQLRAAPRARYESAALVSPTAHMRHVLAQHARPHTRHPVEPSWASRLLGRSLAEYRQADRIYVSSEYVRESFASHEAATKELTLFPLTPAARYSGAIGSASSSPTFDIVYVGGLSVVKGVPLLIDAVARLPFADLRLLLVGGPETRGMRRFLANACTADRRIELRRGDPIEHLRGARLYVHPSYCDGFGYAPAEALASGLPVLVSEDTGMKELIETGSRGLVLPTGDLDALTDAIGCAYRGEIFDG